MKVYEFMFRRVWEDYPSYISISALTEYNAVVEFFEYCDDYLSVRPEDIDIIRMEEEKECKK